MKKMFLVAVAVIIATASFSQARFGFQAIGNASGASILAPAGPNLKKPTQIGFGAGVVADIPFNQNLSLRTSLNFLQKKSRFEELGVGGEKVITKVNSNYLELPINLVYKIPLQSMSIYFGAGPSLGYALSGKLTKTDNGGEDEEAGEISGDPFKGEGGLKRFDLSANVNAGIQFNNGLFINAGYLAGLTNLTGADSKYKNHGILLTVGFMLPTKG